MRLRGLDVDDLIILTLMLDNLSVTDIGKKIYLTQPAVTMRIAKMRRFLGFSLTIKLGRHLKLTQKGLPVALAARESLIMILRSLPDALSDWGSNSLVHHILSKRGDRCTNESYDA